MARVMTIVAVVAQLVVLYWPVVTVEGPVSWTDKVVHLLVFAVPGLGPPPASNASTSDVAVGRPAVVDAPT